MFAEFRDPLRMILSRFRGFWASFVEFLLPPFKEMCIYTQLPPFRFCWNTLLIFTMVILSCYIFMFRIEAESKPFKHKISNEVQSRPYVCLYSAFEVFHQLFPAFATQRNFLYFYLLNLMIFGIIFIELYMISSLYSRFWTRTLSGFPTYFFQN